MGLSDKPIKVKGSNFLLALDISKYVIYISYLYVPLFYSSSHITVKKQLLV